MKHGGVMRNGTQFVNWKNMDCLKLIYIELGLHPEAIGEKNDFFFSQKRANRLNKHEVKFDLKQTNKQKRLKEVTRILRIIKKKKKGLVTQITTMVWSFT